MTKFILILAALSAILIKGTSPYSMGAPDQACKRMTPGHGFDPQDGDPLVVLEMSSRDDLAPGGHVDVRLVATDSSTTFKGFILQARSDAEDPVGNFESEEASFMTCGKGIHNSLTHRNSQPKTAIKAR